MSFNIKGTGMYVPEKIVTNDDLSKIVETNDEWITKRVGVKRRHISTGETAADMGLKAAERALGNAGITSDQLDLIIGATVSGENVLPSVSCDIQGKLGAGCMAFDINAACSAFIFMLDVAAGFFAKQKLRNVLVVGAERMSRIVDWSDRSTCVIFGDGAGAAVLSPGDGYEASTFHVKGGDSVLRVPQEPGISPFFSGDGAKPYIHMNGQETFRFAVNSMTADITKVLDDAGLTMDDIALVIPHQANYRIIKFAAEKLGVPEEKFFVNIAEYGNTSSASIPIALCEALQSGAVHRGDRVIFSAFGGGLASAACIVKL